MVASAAIAAAIPAGLAAQANPDTVSRAEAAFVVQAPELEAAQDEQPTSHRQQQAENAPDQTSKVYFPEVITPETIARARARALEQEQLGQARASREEAPTTQVSADGASGREVTQLSDGNSTEALGQLTAAERQVLLQAVQGTDICDRSSDIPAIQELCDKRIETRSAEFTQNTAGSAEDSLLGGGLDADRIATLEAAIARLARNAANSNDFSNQVIASVALNNQSLAEAATQATDADGANDLTPETQAVVNAIVQQLGGN